MGSLLLSWALAVAGVFGASGSWVRFHSTLYPYTILQPRTFNHSVIGNEDVFALGPAGGNVTPGTTALPAEVMVAATPGGKPADQLAYVRAMGGRQGRIVSELRIAGQVVPLAQANFHGLVGRWLLARAAFSACGLVWSLTMSYNVRQQAFRRTMLRMLRSFRLTCAGTATTAPLLDPVTAQK